MKRNPIALLRAAGLAEGVSFLVLLFVAMPLKYFAGLPQAVKVAGWAHGVLFIAFTAALLYATIVARWPIARAALLLVAALLPFGPFIVDRRIKGYDAEFRSKETAA
jgi:integral membrane protein